LAYNFVCYNKIMNMKCTDITVKSVLNVFTDTGYSLNPYRGCSHGCAYCYASGTFWRSHMPEYFSTTSDHFGNILVKTNIATILRKELMSKRPHSIHIGTITDPYQPCEGIRKITRSVLESLLYLPPREIHILTKGTLIIRDIDILRELSTMSSVRVTFTITTLDKKHYTHIEPHAPSPWLRLKAMKELSEAGITVGVSIAPIMPGINDNIKTLRHIWNTARYHGASYFFIDALKLEHSVKKHFLKTIHAYMPGMLKTYRTLYKQSTKPVSFSIYVNHLRQKLEYLERYRTTR